MKTYTINFNTESFNVKALNIDDATKKALNKLYRKFGYIPKEKRDLHLRVSLK